MRLISIESIEPGQILGKSIYTSEGRSLLQSGVSLTPSMINTLRRLGVTMIYISEKEFEDVKLEDVVSDETRRTALKNISEVMQKAQSGKDFDSKSIQQTTGAIVDEILRNKHVLLHLSDVKTKDNFLFIHSINVCIMSVLIGANMNLSATHLKELAIGALLHDLGKTVSNNTENNTAKKATNENGEHTWTGFNLLRKKHEISLASAHVALQHHEYINGTGSPRGLEGEQIHLFAKIVAVANYFDHLISDVPDGSAMPPFEASEYIMGFTNIQFDHEVVIQFLRSIALYPTGSSVKLSTGDIGVVVGQHKGLPSRPIVRVIKKENSKKERKYAYHDHEVIEIDLAKDTTIFITSTLKL
ncbi:HD-GYP domain-containing protein [Caldalkalibacillus mannanilyticus]|uniref:HD-GYP domain-containing protein n=1 Tax=Caldalkalibacillus mannanilyticus TaxID=1418 RepID=UPI00046A8199|nr:HD domain-containing phosphohydrolase [Caldalkalibacillus mannanilyticus]